jgi:hypothetical protein
MDYKLDLPPSSHVHQVFHDSLLNNEIGDNMQIQTTLLEINE